jgi:L-ascorbate metabolism protein UlaG (beta-lactamase superfamily)
MRDRRTFLKYVAAGSGVAAGGFGWWLSKSRQRAARYLRQFLADARRPIAPAPVKPHPNTWRDNQITICWLGHATVLIDFYGIRILTDPALYERVGLSLGLGTAGPKRYVAAALRPKELPPIDVLLLSHAHMDHMDLASLRALAPAKLTITARKTRDILADTPLKQPIELGWNEQTTFRNRQGELTIEAVEVKHWGQRWPSHLRRGYNGYILRREGRALLFGGDTARTELFTSLRSRGPFAAAIMPIGAYRPWIWNHCTPEQAVEMADRAGAGYIVPIHHETFRLSEEPMREPIERLQRKLAAEPERLALTRVGESFTLA